MFDNGLLGYPWGRETGTGLEDPMRSFTMTVEPFDDRTIRVALSGELDLRRAYTFDEELRRIEAGHPQVILLDLRRLDFLDSAGLGRVIACHRRARRDGRRVVIARAPGAVQRVLALAALEEILEIVDRPAAALA